MEQLYSKKFQDYMINNGGGILEFYQDTKKVPVFNTFLKLHIV
jgi:hypothetical protein